MGKDKKIGGVIVPFATPLNRQYDLDVEKAQDLILLLNSLKVIMGKTKMRNLG